MPTQIRWEKDKYTILPRTSVDAQGYTGVQRFNNDMKKLKDAYETDKVTQWRPVNGWKSVESISKILNSPQQTNRATRGRPAGIVPDPVSIEFKRPDPAFVQEILNRRTPVMEVEMVSEPKTKGAISADATANVDNEDDDLVNMLQNLAVKPRTMLEEQQAANERFWSTYPHAQRMGGRRRKTRRRARKARKSRRSTRG